MSLEPRKPVFVVLAIYRPDIGYLTAQIESLARQTYPVQKVVAVIADRTSEALVAKLCDRFGLDVETVVPDAETESYRSFEIGLQRAVEIAPKKAFFALCDQDDTWNKDKLRLSVEAMADEDVAMTHSDAEVVDRSGHLIHASMHRFERRMTDASVRDLLIENTVTGMTTLMDRPVVEAALPFPSQAGLFFHHDLWLSLVASIVGRVKFLPQALVRYRQHGDNVVGAVRDREQAPKFASQDWVRHWACRYGVAAYLAKCLYLRASELVERLPEGGPDRARLSALAPYLACRATGVALLRDGVAHGLKGRFRLARDSAMHGAVQAGRLLLAARAAWRSGTLAELSEFDRKLFAAAPGVQPQRVQVEDTAEGAPQVWSAETFEDRRTVRRFDVSYVPFGTSRFVIMVPTLNPTEIFAGIATALDIGIGLAERGHDVLFVATDLPMASRDRSLSFVRKRGTGLPLTGTIDVACAVRDEALAFSAQDRFMATAWWTAHLAKGLLDDFPFNERQFYYLIQDFEPGFYAWGAEYAGARASYDFDYFPIFNCVPLRDHFGKRGLLKSEEAALTFRPSIDINRYVTVPRAQNAVPRLAVYGRPNVARNLFPVCMTSLERFLTKERIRPEEIDLVSVGQAHPDVVFNAGHRLKSLGKIPWDEYPAFLGGVDFGLSLMHSPHPSHPPLEMAAAGARVVTNDYGAKSLGALSPAITSVAPTVDAVADALSLAWHRGLLSGKDRRVDMDALGAPLSEVVDALSERLAQPTVSLARAS